MGYSTIISKNKKCIVCGREDQPWFSKKRCASCARIEDGMKRINAAKANTPAIANKGSLEALIEDKGLSKWFEYVGTIIKANPVCWNCKTIIPIAYYMEQKDTVMVNRLLKSSSAHIFPKSKFFSVATHPLNFLVLGASCGCHPQFDSSVDNAAEMPIFQMAIDRFRLFEDKITEKHKYLELFKSKIC